MINKRKEKIDCFRFCSLRDFVGYTVMNVTRYP